MIPKVFLQILIILILLNSPSITNSFTSIESNLYEQGIAKKDSGNWEEALNIWETARDSMVVSDPRIGIAYIRLVTEQHAVEYYEKASMMYYWGFSQTSANEFKEVVQKEIERISPLLPKEQYSEWLKLLKKGDSSINKLIRCFWIEKDPIPTTDENERLLEHWERIATARKNFNEDSTSVYGTDDRGLIYVKYGKPVVIYQGKLGIDQLEIMRWVLNNFLIRQEIQRYNTTPEYEIWIYSGLKPQQTTVFLFGKRGGFGKYGLRLGIEDFIPERAFRRSSIKNTGGILPGSMLQIMFYRELIGLDRFYLDRYRELEAIWSNARASGRFSPNYDVLRGLLNHYRSVDRTRLNLKYISVDKSNAFENFTPLDLRYKKFRYLDNEQQPRLSIFVTSNTQDGMEETYIIFFKQERKSLYKIRHILIEYDNDCNVIQRLIDYPAMNNINTSVFVISLIRENAKYVLVAERIKFDERKAKIEEADIPDTVKVTGIGSTTLEGIIPLSGDSTKFEVSDLIVGLTTPTNVDTSLSYPFPVIPRDPIRKSQALRVYLELYHLSLNRDNRAVYTINYEINRLKEKEKIDQSVEGLSQFFKFETSKRTVRENLEIDISKFIPGKYELTVKVTDNNSSQKKTRKASFTVAQ
jgi:GWxTD domain-containing protein